MVLVEDAVIAIKNGLLLGSLAKWPISIDPWQQQFLESVASQCDAGDRLSDKQARVLQKIFKVIRGDLIALRIMSDGEIDQLLTAPQYRLPPYESARSVPREVRYLGDNLLGFRCKADQRLIAQIKEVGVPILQVARPNGRHQVRSRSRFHWGLKIWLVPVFSGNLSAIQRLIRDHHFHADSTARAYLARCERSIEQPSTFLLADGVLVANICDHDVLAAWITEVAGGIVL